MPIEADLIDRTMHLAAADRADLACRLIASLQPAQVDEDADEAWEAEIERRASAIDRGETIPVDWRESVARIRESLEKGSGQ